MADNIKQKAVGDNTDMTISEQVYEMYDEVWGTTATSFGQLQEVTRTGDALEDLQMLLTVAEMLMYNISYYSPDKMADATNLLNDFGNMANALIAEYEGDTSTKEKNPGLVAKARALIDAFAEKAKKRGKRGRCKELNKQKSMIMWKTKEGQYRWLATYSNAFRDDDVPPEIISKESHIKFADMVEKGQVDYPELWHWHVKGSAWGKADAVWFDEENLMAMATGYVYEGHEKEAEALMGTDIEIGVSHGMPLDSITYDSNDKSIITGHITREISDLPLWAAANKLTGFQVLKENTEMAIPKQKEDYLKGLGISSDVIDQINAVNKEKHDTAIANGVENKETTPVAEQASETPTTETPATPEPEAPVAPETKENNEATVEVVTSDQLVEAIKQISSAFGEALKGISDSVTEVKSMVENHVKETSDKESKVNLTPTASLAAIISESMSAAKSKETTVRKNSELATSGPTETPADSQAKKMVTTGNPILDGALNDILTGK